MEIPVSSIDKSTPVLLLGGQENSVSVARSLAGHGIEVSLTGDVHCWGLHSKYLSRAYPIPSHKTPSEYWTELLLSPGNPELAGHVILTLNDVAIDFALKHEAELRAKYRLEQFDRELRIAMLDKQRTLELANQVGVPAPMHWDLNSLAEIHALRDEFKFPLMIKPRHSHLLVQATGHKLFIIESDFEDLVEKAQLVLDLGLEFMVVEMIPGPDSLLSSYYTLMDESGRHLLEYTKRVHRRFPTNRGGGVMHETAVLPETAAMGKKFFEGINWRGLGNIEFKYDERDGKLKIIEVNSRITAAHTLLKRSGLDIDLVSYCEAAGQPAPAPTTDYIEGLRLWYPLGDFRAFLELKGRGELTFIGWLKDVFSDPLILTMPVFSDPKPMFKAISHTVSQNIRRVFERLGGRTSNVGLSRISEIDETDWDRIEGLAECPMQTRDWIETASQTYASGDAVHVMSDSEGGAACFAPLRVLNRNRLRLLGTIDIGESVSLAQNDDEQLAYTADKLIDAKCIIEFGHYPKQPDFKTVLKSRAGRRGFIVSRNLNERAAPVLNFDETSTNIEDKLSRNRRQSLRRKLRKAGQLGEVEFLVIDPKPDDVGAWFERFKEIEAKGWKGRSKTALLFNAEQSDFFEKFGGRMAAKGMLRLCFMKIGEEYVAGHYAVIWQNRFWSIKVAYDEAFKSISPGELLTYELIKQAVSGNHDGFEFCGKEAEWTLRWTDQAQEIESLRYYPLSLSGVLGLVGDVIGQGWRKTRALIAK